jgi:AraC family transcriptional regulator
VVQIALGAGYGTHAAFSRAFRQLFGVSPTQFRASHQFPPPPQELPTMTDASPPRDVRIETILPRRVAFLRHVGPYQEVGPTFQKLAAWIGQRGLLQSGSLVIGIGYDDPAVTPADKIRFDCCVTVDDQFQPDGEVGVQTIEGGECAILTHHGPYERLGDSYGWLYGTWLPASGREPGNSPPFEIYRTYHKNTAPEELLTDLCVPLAPR